MNRPDSSRTDARPIRPTADVTLWDKAAELRDRVAFEIRTVLQARNVEALVLVSPNGDYPAWVKLEAWMPPAAKNATREMGQERAELLFTIHTKEYHEKSLVIAAQGKRGRRTMRFWRCPNLSIEDVGGWVRYALGRGAKPPCYSVASALLLKLLVAVPFLPTPYRNRVQKRFRSRFWFSRVLGFGAAAALFISFSIMADEGQPTQQEYNYYTRTYETRYRRAPDHGPAILLGACGAIAWLASYLIARRRQQMVSVSDEPHILPRNLGLVDSWHTTVAGLGKDYDAIKQRLVFSLKELDSLGLSCNLETYVFRTPNGYEERERVVATKGQSLVHVHIYRFTDDIFVGWDAFLNWAKWQETDAVARKIKGRSETEYRQLAKGTYIPNQFDLIDLDSLSELVHRRLERELKAILKEKAIDQEIDFAIIRGDRDRALDKSKRGGEAALGKRLRYFLGQQS